MRNEESSRPAYSAATQRFEQALTLARDPSGGDPRTAVAALSGLGWTASQQGAYDAARRHLEKGLMLAREHNDREGIARALRYMGSIASTGEGDFEKAERCIVESLTLCRELGNRQGIANALNSLGIAALLQGKHEEARTHLEEGLALHREIGDRTGIGTVLSNLGENARKQAKYEEAIRYNEDSLAISRELGLRAKNAISLNNLGHVYFSLGEDDTAWGYLREALEEAVAIGVTPYLVLEPLVGVAGLQARAGRHTRAAELLGLVLGHPAFDEETRQYAELMLTTLRETLPADALEAALARGESLDYEAVITEILEEAAR